MMTSAHASNACLSFQSFTMSIASEISFVLASQASDGMTAQVHVRQTRSDFDDTLN